MKRTFTTLLIVLLSAGVVFSYSDSLVYVFRIDVDRSSGEWEVSYNDFELRSGSISNSQIVDQPDEGFNVSIVSFKNRILFSYLQYYPFEEPREAADPAWFDDEGNQVVVLEGDTYDISADSVVAAVPYFYNGKEILVKDNGKLLFAIDVSQHSLCNENGVCDENEYFDVCPQDCVFEEPVKDNRYQYIKGAGGLLLVSLIALGLVKVRGRTIRKIDELEEKEGSKKVEKKDVEDMKKCPNCGEHVDEESLGCVHCGHEF